MKPISSINPFNTTGVNFASSNGLAGNINKMDFIDATPKTSFKNVISNVVQDTNKTLTLPDELMNQALTTGNVDIHQIMIANTKADIAVNFASTVVTKVIQAYDRVQQIQV